MLLVPPWQYLHTIGAEGIGSFRVGRSAGYHPVFVPPGIDTEALRELFDARYGLFDATVDVTRLLIQLAFVVVTATCVYVIVSHVEEARLSDG
jgi:hypothetical protein